MEKPKTAIIASAVSDRSYYIRLSDNRLVMIDLGCVDLTQKNVDWQKLFEDFVAELQNVCQSEIIRVAALFITHPHDDHVNLLEHLQKTGLDKYFKFEKIIRSFPPKTWVPQNNWEKPGYPDLIENVLQNIKGAEIITARRGMKFSFNEAEFEILLTPNEAPDDAKDLNYFSLLIKQTVGGKRVLWTGDMSDSLSRKAMELYKDDLKCDILQVPHHGTPNGGIYEFFELCGAKIHLWTIAGQTFLDPEYRFCYGKYPVPTAVYDMPVKNIFCKGEKPFEIPLD